MPARDLLTRAFGDATTITRLSICTGRFREMLAYPKI